MSEKVAVAWPIVLLSVWTGTSAIAASLGNADHFQRAGVLGIAAAIAMFSYARHKIGRQEELLTLQERRAIGFDVRRRIIEVQHKMQKRYDKSEQDKSSAGQTEKELSELLTENAEILEEQKEVREALGQLRLRVTLLEGAILILATLQTGYGDVLLSAIKGAP